MKICLIHNRFGTNAVGGAEAVVLRLAKMLQMHGHEVFVITSGRKRVYEYEGIVVYELDQHNAYPFMDGKDHGVIEKLRWHKKNLHHRAINQQVVDIIEQEQADIVHTHNLMGLSLSLPHALAALGSVHIHTVHDVQLLEPSGIIIANKERTFRYHNPLSMLYRFWTKAYTSTISTVTAPSQRMLDRYARYGFFTNAKNKVIHHALSQKSSIQKEQKSSDKFTVGYIGQLTYHKGIDLFLAAVCDLHDMQVRIAGDGELRSLAEEAATRYPHITYDGKLNKQDVDEWYAQVDAVVIPSRCIENAPNVIFECAAVGVPLIVSSADCLPEFIKDKKTGVVFETNMIASLQEHLRYAATHQHDMQRYAKEMAAKKWGSLEDYVALYEQIIGRR